MRGPPVCLRALTVEERSAIETLARSRTAPARRAERDPIVAAAGRGGNPPPIAADPGVGGGSGGRRIPRHKAVGLGGGGGQLPSGRAARS